MVVGGAGLFNLPLDKVKHILSGDLSTDFDTKARLTRKVMVKVGFVLILRQALITFSKQCSGWQDTI